MVASTTRGYPFLQPSDPPDIAGSQQNLATAIDSDITSLQQARQMQRNTTANIPDGTATGIFGWPIGPTYNVGGIAYASGLFTVTVPGLYRWSFTVQWPSTTTTHSRQQFVYLNGVTTAANEGRNAWSYYGAQSTNLFLSAGGELVMAVGDTLQAVVAHNAGSTLAVSPTTFTLVRAA